MHRLVDPKAVGLVLDALHTNALQALPPPDAAPGAAPPPPDPLLGMALREVLPGPAAALGTVLEGRGLAAVDLSSIVADVAAASFRRADLTGADLSCSRFADTAFDMAAMAGAELGAAQWRRCTFLGADLRGCGMRQGSFADCVFRRTRLSGCDLRGCVFVNCDFALCDLSGARVDGATLFYLPQGWGQARRAGTITDAHIKWGTSFDKRADSQRQRAAEQRQRQEQKFTQPLKRPSRWVK
jgi:hypothetical protein